MMGFLGMLLGCDAYRTSLMPGTFCSWPDASCFLALRLSIKKGPFYVHHFIYAGGFLLDINR